jgi:hypothetical protein
VAFRKRTSAGAAKPGPQLRDWLLLAVGIAFCLAALVIWPHDWRRAVVTLTFFGACTAGFAFTIARKLRSRRFRATQVSIAGSVDIPISRTRFVIIAAVTIVIGAVLVFVEREGGWVMQAIGWGLLLFGAGLIAGQAMGLLGRQYLRFEPGGIVVGERRYSFTVPWEAMEAIGTGEYHDNAVVLLGFSNLDMIQVSPETQRARLYKRIAFCRGWFHTDWFIMCENYGLASAPLAAALARYLNDPEARKELAPRIGLPSARY